MCKCFFELFLPHSKYSLFRKGHPDLSVNKIKVKRTLVPLPDIIPIATWDGIIWGWGVLRIYSQSLVLLFPIITKHSFWQRQLVRKAVNLRWGGWESNGIIIFGLIPLLPANVDMLSSDSCPEKEYWRLLTTALIPSWQYTTRWFGYKHFLILCA